MSGRATRFDELLGDLLSRVDVARQGSRLEAGEFHPLGHKAMRTRQRVLEAGYACFVREGYAGTSVPDIHEAAGVSLGTFYTYFRSKSAVVVTLVAEQIAAFVDVLADAGVADGGLSAYVHHYARTADFQRVWEEATHLEPEVAEFRWAAQQAFDAWLARGIARPGLDAASTARLLNAMIDRYCYMTFVVDGHRDPATVDRVLALLSEAIHRVVAP